MNRKILLTCLVLILVVCLVLSVVSILGAGFVIINSETQRGDVQTQEISPTETITEVPTETEAEFPDQEDSIPPSVLAEMALIQQQVIKERGLEATGVFTRVLYTKDQLRQRLMDDFLEDYDPEEEADYAIVREVFGLLNRDFDMYNFYLDLYTEQIAGFYDNETKEMVVVLAEGFEGPERLTYAHEYTHALQDQNYDIREGLNYNDDACEEDSEGCAALQALLEGDATLSELNWFQENATTEDKTEIFDFYSNLESPILESAPAFFAKDLLFPYEAGYEFVQYLYDRDGWEAVDQAYRNRPVSTEQILHPERYPEDVPRSVSLPELSAILGEGWQEIDQNVVGEWYTYLILAHGLDEDWRINETQAAEAAEGWGGDSYIVFHHPDTDETVMVFRASWESSKEAEEFIAAFQDYAEGRFGEPVDEASRQISWEDNGEVHVLLIDGVYTTWIAAPDRDLADAIRDAILKE